MKKAVLFDIDGTVLDTREFVFDAVKYALAEAGYPYPEEEVIKKAMCKPLVEFYKTLLSDIDPIKLSELHQEFQKENYHLIKPFPETQNTLRVLKDSGFLMAAVSNRMRESLLYSLKLTKILAYFDVVVAAEDVVNPKPHQDHLLTALKSLQIRPEKAFMIGDTENDILAGKNAKVKTVGVTYGWLGTEIKKHNPDYVIDGIGQLLEILK